MNAPTKSQGTSPARQLRGVLAARFSDKFRISMSCLLCPTKKTLLTLFFRQLGSNAPRFTKVYGASWNAGRVLSLGEMSITSGRGRIAAW